MTETYFKEGDKVTCSMYGQGFVSRILTDVKYNIVVSFPEHIRKYTFDGKENLESKRTLHQGHISIPEPELVPIVEYTKGEVVWYCLTGIWLVGFYEKDSWVRSQNGNLLQTTNIRKFDNPPTFKP
jgi:hypothetical protein